LGGGEKEVRKNLKNTGPLIAIESALRDRNYTIIPIKTPELEKGKGEKP